MTPTRQAACLTLAGLASLLLLATDARSQQNQPVTQPPAPVVRVAPRPLVRTQPRTQTGAAGQPRTGAQAASGSTAHRPVMQSTGSSQLTHAVPPGTAATEAAGAEAQSAEHKISATGLNRQVIVIDPAHGGTDSGARIGDTTLEKDVTLAFAFRLRSLLLARGFTVIMTRDSDTATEPNSPETPLSLDDRAGIANHARAAACLLVHATGRGLGVHLYSSELDAAPAEAYLLPWLTAQAAWVPASQSLEQQLGAALGRSRIALVSSTASVRPVDSLTCPAVVVELAPETDTPASVNDAGYQERVASALAGALVFWQNAVQPPVKLPPPPRPHPTATGDTDSSGPGVQP